MGKRTAWPVAAALLCLALDGCATPPGPYLVRRAADCADCFQVSGGVGLMAYGRVKVTDFLILGMGIAVRERYGWRGRYGDRGWEKQRGGDVYLGDVHYEAALPIVANEEGSDGGGARISTLGPFLTTRRYPPELEPGPGGRVADRFWIGLAGTAGLSLEIGFNLAEFLDFLVGLAAVDMLGDDDWRPKPPEPEPSPTPPAAP